MHQAPEGRVVERNHYFSGKLLTAQDLAAEQAYFLDKDRAHNRLHGHGTVCGLSVEPTDPPSAAVVVRPGVALDCRGRELVVGGLVEVDVSEATGDATPVFITLEYGEEAIEPIPGPPDGGNGATPNRIREVPTVRVDGDRPTSRLVVPRKGGGPVPCRECEDARVLLARLDVSPPGPITDDRIDNGVRPIVATLAGGGGRVPNDADPVIERLERRVSVLSAAMGVLAAGVLGTLMRCRRR